MDSILAIILQFTSTIFQSFSKKNHQIFFARGFRTSALPSSGMTITHYAITEMLSIKNPDFPWISILILSLMIQCNW